MKRPDWLTDRIIVEETTFEWDGVIRPLYVLISDLPSAPPNFLGFPPPRQFFIVSEDVPENYWRAVLGHEAMEFLDLEGQSNRCCMATQRELELVDPAELEEYVIWRIKFFIGLAKWAMEKSTNGDDDQMLQMRETAEGAAKSLDYLFAYLRSLPLS